MRRLWTLLGTIAFLLTAFIPTAWAQYEACSLGSEIFAYCALYRTSDNIEDPDYRQISIQVTAFETRDKAADQADAWRETYNKVYAAADTELTFGDSQLVLVGNNGRDDDRQLRDDLFHPGDDSE